MSTSAPVSTAPLFGRKWDLTITTQSGDQIEVSSSAWEPEALRVSFDIQQVAYASLWFAEISIWNLSSSTANIVVGQGDTVTLSAGYQAGQNYGEIFSGKILQPLFEKVDVVDYKITLHCVIGLQDIISSIVNFAQGPQSTQGDCVRAICKNAKPAIPLQYVSPTLDSKRLVAPKVFAGAPSRYFDQIARDNNMLWFRGPNGVYIGPPQANSGSPDITYSAPLAPGSTAQPDTTISYSIIGTPQQTQQGVNFRVLLDSRLMVQLPAMQVKIDNTSVRQLPVYPGSFPPVLSQDGIYVVSGVRHIGDSRGNEWYSEITGFTSVAGKLALLGAQGLDLRHFSDPSSGTSQ